MRFLDRMSVRAWAITLPKRWKKSPLAAAISVVMCCSSTSRSAVSAGKRNPFAQMRFLLLIFGSGQLTIAGEIVLLIQVAKPVLSTQAPSCGPPRGGFPFGLVVYLILLVPPLWGILPNSLRQQGLSGNSLCDNRKATGITS